jgi:PAS domain S-box-containing protein
VKEREFARTRLSTWLPVPQMEGELRLPDGGDKLVLIAGHPIEVSDQRCMLFTFADLEPRRRAETALRQSEERFAKSFRLAPAPMKLASLKDFRLIGVNHAFAQATGWSADELVGRSSAEVELWDSADTRRAVEKQLVETGTLRGVEVQLRTKKGWTIPCLASAETMLIDGEQCVLTVLQDISERKRTENELVAAVEAALQDSTWLSRGILDKLANVRALGGGAPAMTVSAAPEALTTRERDVLALIARGRNDKAIADALGLSTTTVRNHVARLYGKLGVHSRAEAVIWARERGYGSEPA